MNYQHPTGNEEVSQGMAFFRQQNYPAALQCFRRAAELGNGVAMNNLSVCYAKGTGVPVDRKQSFEWMKRACEAGYTDSFYTLAAKYFNGDGTPRSYTSASFWAKRAIEVNSPDAANARQLLSMVPAPQPAASRPAAAKPPVTEADQQYAHGRKLYNEKRYEEAMPLLEKAAKSGHADALCTIGEAYALGHGLTADSTKAWNFFCAAAFRGSKMAARHLAKAFSPTPLNAPWKLYGQYKKLQDCEETFTKMSVEAQNSRIGDETVWNAKDAMIRAAQCWKHHLQYPNERVTVNAHSAGRGSYAARCFFEAAIRFGNIDALCGSAAYWSSHPENAIGFYMRAAYLGHSYAMYQVGQFYDSIDRKAADACYRQAANWNYEPAIQMCRLRGIAFNQK